LPIRTSLNSRKSAAGHVSPGHWCTSGDAYRQPWQPLLKGSLPTTFAPEIHVVDPGVGTAPPLLRSSGQGPISILQNSAVILPAVRQRC